MGLDKLEVVTGGRRWPQPITASGNYWVTTQDTAASPQLSRDTGMLHPRLAPLAVIWLSSGCHEAWPPLGTHRHSCLRYWRETGIHTGLFSYTYTWIDSGNQLHSETVFLWCLCAAGGDCCPLWRQGRVSLVTGLSDGPPQLGSGECHSCVTE